MTISMYSASVPAFVRVLKNMDAIIDKAVVWADAKKIDHQVLLNARLAPDMFALTRQFQIVTDQAKGCVSRLAGIEIPKYEDNEKSFAELKARIARTINFVQSIKPEQINGTEDKQIVLQFGPARYEYTGHDYLVNFVNFNIFFHATTAYAILRHNGLEIGKRDFVGG